MKDFLERHNICPIAAILLTFGILAGIAVLGEEAPRIRDSHPMTGSGLISGFAILSGALLQISKRHAK